MAYVEIYTAATDAAHVLRKQVAVALCKAAVDIFAESVATPLHKEREFWAAKVMRDPVAWAAIGIWKVLETAAIRNAPTTSTDADVQTAVNALVNDLWRA